MSFEACAACQTANPLHREHCLGCGIRIRLRCLHCWRLHPVDAERCGRSGLFIPNEWRTAPPFQYRLRPWLDRWRAARKPVAAIALVALLLTLPRGNTVPLPTPPGPRIDVCFLIDSTGSMGDEIDVVKARVVKMMDQIQAGKPRPRVRFGVVAFRDKGDEYLTRACDFSGDSQRVRAFINDIVADGGGDEPESVNEGLRVAVHEMDWEQAGSRMIFLIGDAPPHLDYPDQPTYQDLCREARDRRIQINVLGCSGIAEGGLAEFREIASAGGGSFDFLTYRQQVADSEGRVRYALYEGDKRYVTDEKDDDWRGGAARMVARGKAASGGAAMAPAGAAMENNLDSVLTERVKNEAKKMGVSY